MGMIERIARALCKAARQSENAVYQGKPMWRAYENTARLVLEAMREPSLEMLAVPQFDWKVAVLNWHAMIDAALDPLQIVSGSNVVAHSSSL